MTAARNGSAGSRSNLLPPPRRIVCTIYDQTYDLTDFVRHHPGGPIPLLLVNATDATELFESYHPRSGRHLSTLNALAQKHSAPVKAVCDGTVAFRIEVQDSGIGIRPEQLETIFDQFTQAESSTARRYGGTGLGLAITKRLVETMGGTVGVRSTHGSGSTFWLDLELPRPRSRRGALRANARSL